MYVNTALKYDWNQIRCTSLQHTKKNKKNKQTLEANHFTSFFLLGHRSSLYFIVLQQLFALSHMVMWL